MSENPIFRLFKSKEYVKFARLREKVQWEMTLQLHDRRQNNPQYTPEEESIGVYLEQLEPQVREAVLEFNRKGYRTISSGFSGGFSRGEYNPEHQEIAGHSFVDDETKQKLAAMDVEVTPEPSWTWEMDKKLGKADQNTPPEGRLITTVRFQAKQADLQEIENKWKKIASLLPDKKQA
jgi:hypothetical protein